MKIKLLPEDERPIEKTCRHGIETLSNSELIALIIKTGTKNKSAINLAEEVLSLSSEGLVRIGTCSMEDLLKVNGIGKAKASSILASVELGKRISTYPIKKRISVESSADVARLFMDTLRYEKKEHFKNVLLNSKGEIITIDKVSIGELSSTVVHPREVFCKAVRKSAAAVIFVHNHPSGDPSPSDEDIRTTKRLMEAGDILGIRVLDHIIIGDGVFKSLRALNLLE